MQSAGAKSGKRDRAENNKQSGAASESDARDDNKRAKEEHPEAPGPVIGMNDERGGVRRVFVSCFVCLFVGFWGWGWLTGVWWGVEGSLRRGVREVWWSVGVREGGYFCGERGGGGFAMRFRRTRIVVVGL